MGALRIKEILGGVEDESLKYYKMLKEYIEVNLEGLDFFEDNTTYKNLIVVGGEISVISALIGNETTDEVQYMKKKAFRSFANEMLSKSTDEIKQDYAIKRERAEIIVPSIMLFNCFIDMTTSKEIIIPNVSLADGIIRYIHEDIYQLHTDDVTIQDIITNAMVIARQYNYNEAHCSYVDGNAMLLFDKLKKVHGLKEERTLLKVAIILHDIGKFISLDSHSEHSYDLIRSLELFGMSRMDMEMVANVARYHSMNVPKEKDVNFNLLPTKERIIVAKLIAIIRIADALDRGHKQKIEIKSVKIKDKQLIVRGTSIKNTLLEEWNFALKSKFFKEVFGVAPILTITRKL
jgi:exopolyphosphatase/guanosine-5'-triphosphate,3'-diphosphate pyrophosphatase